MFKTKMKSAEKIESAIKESGDSDTVVDLGICKRPSVLKINITRKPKNHIVFDSQNGMYVVHVFCKHVQHLFKHSINVPNKNGLICRGCGEDI